MINCPNCKSINVKSIDLNFARIKKEGEPAAKISDFKKQFFCYDCNFSWDFNPESEKLYLEYIQLRDETALITQIIKPGDSYVPKYIDSNKLNKRKEIAKELTASHQHTLDIKSDEWYELQKDAI
jgi:hypothetical protein